MRKIPNHCLIAAIAIGVAAPPKVAGAMSLMDAYSLALGHDPTFLAAVKARDAGASLIPIARASLLPSIHYSQNYAPSNHQSVTSTRTGFYGDTSQITEDRKYSSHSAAITLRQPILDYESWEKYRQSTIQALFEDARLRAGIQDLAYRLLSSYIGVLYASDQLALANEQKNAYSKQLVANQATFTAGESTLTDVIETQAQLELASTSASDALDQLNNAQALYESIVGAPIALVRPSPLKNPLVVKPLQPSSLAEWKSSVVVSNADLTAERFSLQSAQSQIAIEKSRHYPRLELYASHMQNRSDTVTTYQQRYRTNTIGLQLSIPIFTGGGVSAQVERAISSYESARYTVQAKETNVLNQLELEYNFVSRGKARIDAHCAAVKAAKTRVTATRRSIIGGERRNLDLIDAERQYFLARRDLAKARYEYLLSLFKLHYLAGAVDTSLLEEFSRAFILDEPTQQGGTKQPISSQK